LWVKNEKKCVIVYNLVFTYLQIQLKDIKIFFTTVSARNVSQGCEIEQCNSE